MNKPFLLLALLISGIFYAQEKADLTYYLPEGTSYDEAIPTPKSIIGHEVGEWHVTHDKLVMYMRALAAASDRISIDDRGTTYEGRPLVLLTITSPENHANLENIRTSHIALTEENAGALSTAEMPVVVYQGFSIHGNEPSGSNAALAVAYHLAAAQGPEIENLLRTTVILFDPSLNPDGLQRFSTWVNMHKSENINPDPNDREYDEVWPGGRTNHYWFDMNRDWLPVQLPESRVRIETFHKWYPNILTDHHEMGTNSTFFFQPGVPSRTHPLTPSKNQSLTMDIARFHAATLDNAGSLYYAEENFDDFYYGKGSTFPDINGAVGILFEQASSRGHAQESENGVLTFPFTIKNQFLTALSTLEAAVAMRQELLDYQRNFYEEARKEKAGAIVFGSEKDAARSYHLADILKKHKIKVHEVKDDFTLNGKNYKKGYSYIVPKNQRQSRLLKGIFEKRTTFEDSLFYDISAWTFPLAFNLDYDENAAVGNIGNEIAELKMRVPAPVKKSNYAYLMEWHEYYTPKALNQILQKDLRAKVSMQPFSLEGKDYDYGTIMIPIQNQGMSSQEIADFLSEVSRENHVDITGVFTGLTNGIDLGSSNFKEVIKPKVALLTGDGVDPYDAGEIWHLFDQRYAMKITKLDTRGFGRTDLSRYTHIIIPNSWGSALEKGDTENITNWVKSGGVLIGYNNTARWMDSNELLKMKFKKVEDTAKNISFEDRSDFWGAKVIGGAIFETKVDRSHPVNFGYKNSTLPVFKNSTLFVEPDVQSYNNPILFTENPLMSGYIHEKSLKALGSTAYFKSGSLGRGKVILFTENTNFRAFWFGTNKLLMNAIFFGDHM